MALELTTEQKIKVIEGARKVLGPNGENWVKGVYFGVRRPLTFTPHSPQHSPLYTLEASPAEAECWCVLGALEESAYRLGLKPTRRRGKVMSGATSLRKLLRRKLVWEVSGTRRDIDWFNDKQATTYADIKALLDERLRELRKELKAEKA